MKNEKTKRIILTSSTVIISVAFTTVFFLTISYLIPMITWSVPISRPFDRSAIISFSSDDGTSNEANTAIIMRECGYRCTFYVASSNIGRSGYMTYDQLRQLELDGFEIGSHGATHIKLTMLPLIDAIKEMTESKAILESQGLHVNCFSFPYGSHNSTLDDIANRTYDYVRYNYTSLTNGVHELINQAVFNKDWINLVFHGVNPSGHILKDNQPTDLNLREILTYVAQSSTPVLTQIQAHYLNQVEVSINTKMRT